MLTINRSIFNCAWTITMAMLLISCSSTQSVNENTAANDRMTLNDSEGMWLMPQVKQQAYPKMKKMGVSLDSNTIYHPDSTAMNRAIVRINAGQSHTGSGSFVSDEGLVLTSYKAAYSGITNASTSKQNYLADGFYADSRTEEIPLDNYRLFILIEQQDVTDQLEERLGDSLTYRQRQQRSQQIKNQIIAKRKGTQNNIAVAINDVMGGNRQVMSVYRVIQDVRIVHAPPAAAGHMGRNKDNWKWPRHSADYTFLRAYVGPNGEARTYNHNNVPFSPETHLTVSNKGVTTGDFTFTMGFPGQTSRHKSSYHLQFYRNHQFPIITEAYRAILDGLQYTAAQDSQAAIENASRRESIANTLQYYQSASRGFEEHDIIASKQKTEQAFKTWIKQDSLRNIRYRRVLSQLDQAYNIASQTGDLLFANIYTLNNLRLFEIANIYHSYRQTIADTTQRTVSQTYKDSLLNRHQALLNDLNIRGQQITLAGMLEMLNTLPEGKVIFHLLDRFGDAQGDSLERSIDLYLDNQRKQSLIYDIDKARAFLKLPIDSARTQPVDEMVQLYRALLESYEFSRKNYIQHIPYRNPARELYVKGMQEFLDRSLAYSDANGTLRLSMGTVQGYSPADGLFYQPRTTFQGLLAKQKVSADPIPQLSQYQDSIRSTTAKNHPQTINFLTTSDITGGSEGSPVLNADGEIVGITFNNTLEGVVGDYRYQPDIKRAINIDIGYILFMMNRFSDSNRLQKEMGITPAPK